MPGSIARYNERNKHCKSQVLGSLSCVASVRSSLQSVSRFCKKRVDMLQQIFTLMQQQIPFKRVKFPRPKQTASAPPFVNAVVKYSSARSMSFISAQQPHWPFDMTPIIAPPPIGICIVYAGHFNLEMQQFWSNHSHPTSSKGIWGGPLLKSSTHIRCAGAWP